MAQMDYEIAYVQKQLSTVWPNWRVSGKLGKGSYGNVYEIVRDDLGVTYTCALKVLQMEAQSGGGYAGAVQVSPSPRQNAQGQAAGQQQNTGSRGSQGTGSQGSLNTGSHPADFRGAPAQQQRAHSQHSLARDSALSDAQARIAQRTVWDSSSSFGMQAPPPDLLFGDISGSEVEEFIRSVSSEIDLMMQLKGVPNIVTIEDYAILRDNNKCTILIRMEELEPLNSYLRRKGGVLNKEEIVRVGTDICSALIFCEQKNILHRDIKTSNLFYSREAGFKLGDFGISRSMASIREKAAMSGIGTIQFMAPEIYQGREYNNTADIYSLGIVLYTLANGLIPPLCDNGSGSQSPALSREYIHEANMRRLRGEALPPPRYADKMLASAICTACNPVPEYRFRTAAAFRQALITSLRDDARISSEPVPPPAGPNSAGMSEESDRSSRVRIFALTSIAIASLGILLFLVLKLFSTEAGTDSQDADSSSPSGAPVAEQDSNSGAEDADKNSDGDEGSGQTEETAPEGPETADPETVSSAETDTDAGTNTGDNTGDNTDTEADTNTDSGTDVVVGDSFENGVSDDSGDETASDSVKTIQWSDTNLQNAVTQQVHEQLGISGEITIADAMKVQKLDLTASGISDISSLSHFVGLTNLELGNNFITDISALSNLKKLQDLNLEQNMISDVTALSGLTRLKELDLNENNIEDISSLSGLTQLTMLDIRTNYISDISALKNMSQMEELYMSSNSDLQDLTPLADMPALWYLSFKETAVKDISPLKKDTALKTLSMGWTGVTDISVVDNFTRLTYLDIRGCSIKDYGPANRVEQRKGSQVKR